MGSGGLRRAHLHLHALVAGRRQEVVRATTRLGGLSGVLGEQEEGDDKEASAVVELHLLGLPLRPLVLFSSLGELMELYWSGAGQAPAQLLQGSAVLLHRRRSLPLATGLPLHLRVTAVASVEASGHLAASMWTQSGGSSLEVGAAVVVRLEARVAGLLLLSTEVTAESAGSLDTKVQMGGQEPLVCAMAVLNSGRVQGRSREGREGEEERVVRREVEVQGVTWNLGASNNRMCRKTG